MNNQINQTNQISESYYQVGGSLPVNAPNYVPRKADEDLFQFLKRGEFCYVLNSRQMGKSSLQVRTMQRLMAENIVCAAIDISEIGNRGVTPEQWYAGILRILENNLHLSEYVNIRTWWREREMLSPVQKFSEFIEKIILPNIPGKIVIFIDEIDSILSLNFSVNDFLALIRSCYNKRAFDPTYNRLTFVLLGVSTPADLQQSSTDLSSTPFNIGQPIELTGFQINETGPLLTGLQPICHQPDLLTELMAKILYWTGGQPFLTQKVCKLLRENGELITDIESQLRDLIFTKIINNWESQDIPQHLKTIRDRLLIKDDQMIKRLGLYEKILEQTAVVWESTPEYLQLQLAGIVVKNGNKLVIANQIYRQIFPLDWVKNELAKIPPYAANLELWISSDQQDKTALLQDEDLEIALTWAKNKNLRNIDFQYLTASQNFALENQYQHLKRAQWETKFVELQVKNARKKARSFVKVGSLILAISLIISGLSSWLSYRQLKRAKISQEIEENSTDALLLAMFKNTENQQSILDALPPAILAGAKLDNLVNQQTPIDQYPATRPLLALQIILDHLHNHPQFSQEFPSQQQRQLIGHKGAVTSLDFSQDGQFLVSSGIDDQIMLWHSQGEKIRQWSASQKSVKYVLFSQDSQYILSVGDLNSIKLWDLAGKKMTELTINLGPISSVSLSDRYLAIASLTGEIWLGEIVRQDDQVAIKPVSTIKNQELIKTIKFNENGEILATLDGKSNLQLWNLSKLSSKSTPKKLAESIVSIAFSPTDPNILLTSNTNGLMQFWQVTDSKLVNQFATLYLDTRLINLSHDSAYLATVGIDRRVRLWNLSGRQVAQYDFSENLIDLDFHPQQQLLAIAGSDGKIFLRSVKTLSELLTEACTFFQNTPERSPQVLTVCKDYQKN